MTKKQRYERVPTPAEKPEGMNSYTWKNAKKRGWYCPLYMKKGIRGTIQLYDTDIHNSDHKGKPRHVSYNGKDILATHFNNYNSYEELYDFVCKAIHSFFKRYGLTWDYVQKSNPGLEWQDIIHEGLVRILEVRSDPRGSNNINFFLHAAINHCGSYIKSLKKHRQGAGFLVHSLNEMQEKKAKEIACL